MEVRETGDDDGRIYEHYDVIEYRYIREGSQTLGYSKVVTPPDAF